MMRPQNFAKARIPAWASALAVITGLQIAAAFALRALAVVGPELTAAAGVDPQNVGILAGVASLGSMWFLMSGSAAIGYLGPLRMLQIGVLIAAAGALLGLAANWWVLVAAAFFIGLGSGPGPPACSEIVTRVSPPGRLGLIMSIKQSGIPLGGALAGLLLPAVSAWVGFEAAMLATAALAAAGAVLAQPWRARLDAGRDSSRRPTVAHILSRANLATPFTVLREIPGMASLTGAVFCISSVQACIFAFFVTQLTAELGFSLAAAGAAFAAMQVSGAICRIIMGGIADKLGGGRTILILSAASTIMTAVLSQVASDWPLWVVVGLGAAIGLTSISWNGVHLAMVARIAPAGRTGEATSGSVFFTYAAFSAAPFLFALGVAPAGGYGPCFAVMAIVQALAIPFLLRFLRQNR